MSNELVSLVEGVKSDASARFEAIGKQNLELASRVQSLEQSPRGGATGGQGPREDTPADIVLKSPALQAFREGTTKTLRVAMKSLSVETKAVTMTDSGAVTQPYRAQEVFGPLGLRVQLRTLIPTIQISTSSVDYAQVTRVGLPAQQILEGDLKAQVDLPVVLVHAPVITIACFTMASNQLMFDNLLMRDFLGSTLMDALQIAEDAAFINGPGGSGLMAGFKTVAPVYARFVTGDTPIDTLRKACTVIQWQHGQPTGIVVSPDGLESLQLRKNTLGNYVLDLEVDVFGRTTIWTVPVVTSTAMASMDFLVGDFARGARIYDRQQAMIEISMEDRDNFIRNLSTIRAEERLALAIARPSLFVQGTFV